MHLPIAPLHAKEFVSNVDEDGLSSGFLRPAHHEVGLVGTIHGSVFPDFSAGPVRQCDEEIYRVNDFV